MNNIFFCAKFDFKRIVHTPRRHDMFFLSLSRFFFFFSFCCCCYCSVFSFFKFSFEYYKNSIPRHDFMEIVCFSIHCSPETNNIPRNVWILTILPMGGKVVIPEVHSFNFLCPEATISKISISIVNLGIVIVQ